MKEDLSKEYTLHDLLVRQPLSFIPFYHHLQQVQAECNHIDERKRNLLFSFYHLLRKNEATIQEEGRRKKVVKKSKARWHLPNSTKGIFTPLPVADRKRIHIPIDSAIWTWFCHRLQPKPASQPMAKVLQLKKIGTRLPFDPVKGSFTTNGYKACVHFGLVGRKARKAVATSEKNRIKEGKAKAKETKTWFAKEKCETKLEQIPTEVIHNSIRIVAIDPGKRAPITGVVAFGDDEFDPQEKYDTVRFSAGELYHWQGRAESTKRNQERAGKYEMEEFILELSKLAQPTTSASWIAYISARTRRFGDINASKYYFHPDRSRWEFQDFSARQRTLDEIANRIFGRKPKEKPKSWTKKKKGDKQQPPLQRTLVAFGDGTCQQGVCAKGAPKIPLLALKRHLAKRPEAIFALVQESYTSQVCSLCPHPHRVTPCRCSHDATKECWSVRACQGFNYGLPAAKFIDRDVNAARNILAITLARAHSRPRPPPYTSEFWPGWKEHQPHGSHVTVGNSHPPSGECASDFPVSA